MNYSQELRMRDFSADLITLSSSSVSRWKRAAVWLIPV